MKMKRKILLSLAALAVPLLLSGCVNRRAEEKKLAKALEEKYGEEFIVADSFVGSASWIDVGSLEAVCYPLSDKNLTFKASYSIKNQKLNGDKYVEAIVREEAYAEMEQILSQYYTDFFLDVDACHSIIQLDEMSKYTKFTNIEDVSIASYEEKYGEKMIISFYIILNIDEIDDYEEVEPIFQQYSEKFSNGRVNYFCYYEPVSTINECQEIKDKRKYISNKGFILSTQMGSRQQHPMYRYCFWDGKFSLFEIEDADGVKHFNENLI